MSKQLRRPFHGCCAISDKKDKQQDNRSIRNRDKAFIKHGRVDDLPLKDREDIWNYNKDGKCRIQELKPNKKYSLYELRHPEIALKNG
ncbi:MAG: hypothetical protein WC364_14110 [Eubacteriales bacterium]|jgi:hypothetical protein